MINAITLLKRRPDLSVEQFQEYWRLRHADVIARLPGVERYAQSHPLPATYRDGDPIYDGIAELWARNSQAFRDIGVSEAYKEVQADESHFLDRKSIALVLTDEHLIKDGPATDTAVKWIRFFNRKEGMTVEDFQSYWRDTHGALMAALPALVRYLQCHARAGAYAKGRQPAHDGVDMTWFASLDAWHSAMESAAYGRARADQANFLVPRDCPQVIAREYLLID